MKLLSASEDLTIRTLENMKGTLRKLLYLGHLRDSTGSYRHWGLSQVHGEAESQTAFRNAHKSVLKEVLRKPIGELWKEAVEMSPASARANRQATHAQLHRVLAEESRLLPDGCSRRSECHFNSVLRALVELESSQARESTHPVA
jgi:hypothetical protein